MKYFSNKKRPFHLGPFPLERLARSRAPPDLSAVPNMPVLEFSRHGPESMAHSMARFIAMMDTVRDGKIVNGLAEIPTDARERSRHFKAAGYYFDASMAGIAKLSPEHLLEQPRRNPMIDGIRAELEAGQPSTYAAGVDAIYADILASARQTLEPVDDHTHSLVFLVEHTRKPESTEPGAEWFLDTQMERATLLTANTAVVIANYIRMLGYKARAHTLTTTEVDLNRLAVSAGICGTVGGCLENAFVGSRFAVAAVTTTLELEPDLPVAANAGRYSSRSHGPSWWLGLGSERRAGTAVPFQDRQFRLGPHPFEKIKRVEQPTTFIDEERVPRFPKRADFFARALFGDMGKSVQEAAKGGYYVMKSPIGACARRALGALLLLQFGDARGSVSPNAMDPQRNADNIKGASYYLATDAVGLSRAPSWVYYSHDAGGDRLDPYHENAVSMLYDQGFDTMEGASGDDWISVAQSMRAYLRFSLIGGVIAEQIRRMGYSARVHSVLDSEVLQPALLLLSGLGEVSRIGEVILNPFLGPRLKSGAVTTSMPMTHDRPIDFGLQKFCESCNKCARECPSGAITAGPKLMYNGYEIWKSDAEKCARYRLTNSAGGMCGRCMKTCPWNLEGLFADASFRWMAINVPSSAKTLAKLDDRLQRGTINPVKKWWWDIELDRESGRYVRAESTNERGLQTDLELKYEDQTLAVYPADVMPPPYPVVHPLDREEGIKRYRGMLTPKEYRERLKQGETDGLAPSPRIHEGQPPVFPVVVAKREDLSDSVVRYELRDSEGKELPPFEPGAHIDVVIAPEFQREFSLAGNPADRAKYVLGVQKEENGRGGSSLMHKVFRQGRKTFISLPRNHFPLDETAELTLLMAGGIGLTPLIAMAHRLHVLEKEFLFHYSARSKDQCGFAEEMHNAPWSDRVFFHFSNEGNRADLFNLIPLHRRGFRLYACGSERYMDAVFDTAIEKGWPEAGIRIDTKCSDGICGVCATPYLRGDVEHRDYVLSAKERKRKILLCCSRSETENGVIQLDL